jgi:superfamily I DNA/RNA helicase
MVRLNEVDNNDELKEERRLFYVAITRAIKSLHLLVPDDKSLHHWNKNGWCSTPKNEVNAGSV